MNTLEFEGVSFNADHWSLVNEKEFIDQNLKEGKYKAFTKEDRKKLLKEAYRLIKLKVKPTAPVIAVDGSHPADKE